jgi:hypothetical protein
MAIVEHDRQAVGLSIIIVSWNTRDLLKQCLASVYANPPDRAFEVFVVDNASHDGSAAMVRECFAQARVIENGDNVGFARANNQAIGQSTGQYVLLLNSDAQALPDALAEMGRFMDQRQECGLLGANILNPDRTPQACYGNLPGLVSELITLLGLDRRLPLPDRLRVSLPRRGEPAAGFRQVGWVLGAAMLMRRSAMERVGLLDDGYFMFSEEIDWARRVQAAGWTVVYLSTAGVVHYGGASTRQVRHRMLPYLYASKARYLEKYSGRLAALVFRMAAMIVVLLKCVVQYLEHLLRGRQTLRLKEWLGMAQQVWSSR